MELFGEVGRTLLRFDRASILEGELWRLASGHFVHLGTMHFVLNALGLILVWLLVGMHFSAPQWLLVIGISLAGIDAGLWFLDPALNWYVGMSGLLHAMLAAGVVHGMRSVPRESIIIGLVLVVKIGFEQVVGPLPGSERTAGGAVVVNAHLYGVFAGAAAGIMRDRFRRRNNGE